MPIHFDMHGTLYSAFAVCDWPYTPPAGPCKGQYNGQSETIVAEMKAAGWRVLDGGAIVDCPLHMHEIGATVEDGEEARAFIPVALDELAEAVGNNSIMMYWQGRAASVTHPSDIVRLLMDLRAALKLAREGGGETALLGADKVGGEAWLIGAAGVLVEHISQFAISGNQIIAKTAPPPDTVEVSGLTGQVERAIVFLITMNSRPALAMAELAVMPASHRRAIQLTLAQALTAVASVPGEAEPIEVQ